MRVKAIMMPFSKLACISVENTVEEAMKIIDSFCLRNFSGTIQGPEKNLHSEK